MHLCIGSMGTKFRLRDPNIVNVFNIKFEHQSHISRLWLLLLLIFATSTTSTKRLMCQWIAVHNDYKQTLTRMIPKPLPRPCSAPHDSIYEVLGEHSWKIWLCYPAAIIAGTATAVQYPRLRRLWRKSAALCRDCGPALRKIITILPRGMSLLSLCVFFVVLFLPLQRRAMFFFSFPLLYRWFPKSVPHPAPLRQQ